LEGEEAYVGKKVGQFCVQTGRRLGRFDNAAAAAREYVRQHSHPKLKSVNKAISRVLRGERRQWSGLIFRYENDDDDEVDATPIMPNAPIPGRETGKTTNDTTSTTSTIPASASSSDITTHTQVPAQKSCNTAQKRTVGKNDDDDDDKAVFSIDENELVTNNNNTSNTNDATNATSDNAAANEKGSCADTTTAAAIANEVGSTTLPEACNNNEEEESDFNVLDDDDDDDNSVDGSALATI
jgi:hypothetical protein